MDFDLRLLRHARALAEEGSFARASRALHLTQPALSRSIQELERRTGFKLFDRSKGRVELTDLGRVFMGPARELLARAEALDRDLAGMRGAGTGSLAIGSGTFPTAIFMSRAVAAFVRRNPGVGVRLVNDNWAALVSALRRRELDLVVAAQPSLDESAGLAVQPLSRRQGYFLVRAGHPLLARRELALEDVAAFPIICNGRLPADIAERVLAARGSRGRGRPVPDVACESHEMMREVASITDHVLLSALVPNAAAIAAGELAVLPLVEPAISAAFAILRLEGRSLPPIAEEVVREVVVADGATFDADQALAARLVALRSHRSAHARLRHGGRTAAMRSRLAVARARGTDGGS